MIRILALQHLAIEDPGHVAAWAAERGHVLHAVLLPGGDVLPAHDSYDLLLILGGPMNVDEEAAHPWLAAEKEFIRESLASGKAILGVCLGAQLLAQALGGAVTRNPHKEIGWHRIATLPAAATHPLFVGWPPVLDVFHWHGDTFSIPSGAERIAASEACANQAFVFGERAVGLQFHVEYTEKSICAMTVEFAPELSAGGIYVQTPARISAGAAHLPALHAALESLLNAFEQRIGEDRTDRLIDAARRAAANAHAPYSAFRVGAAVLDETGRIHAGCNVENASYGLTICAERNALAAAVLAGARRIEAIAVFAPTDALTPPCGACRQVLAEFAGNSTAVILGNVNGARMMHTLGELLPYAFRFEPPNA